MSGSSALASLVYEEKALAEKRSMSVSMMSIVILQQSGDKMFPTCSEIVDREMYACQYC